MRKNRGVFCALGLSACLCLAAGCAGENTPAPPETTRESAQTSAAETERFSRASVPAEEPVEPFFHLNGDRLYTFKQPDRVTVIPVFREQMGDPPRQMEPETADRLVRALNDLELEGYNPSQSRFEWPSGGGTCVRLFYGEEAVEFHITTQQIIGFKGTGDREYRYFLTYNADTYQELEKELINIQAGMDF